MGKMGSISSLSEGHNWKSNELKKLWNKNGEHFGLFEPRNLKIEASEKIQWEKWAAFRPGLKAISGYQSNSKSQVEKWAAFRPVLSQKALKSNHLKKLHGKNGQHFVLV